MGTHSRLSLTAALSAALAALPWPAAAQDWTLTLSPYVWMTSFNGDVTVRGNGPADVDASFSDILDASDSILAFNSEIELHNGRFGFFVGPSYAQIGVDDVASGTILESDLTVDMLFVDAAVVARVADWPMESTVGGEDTSVTFDVYGGVRYTNLGIELDVDAGGSPEEDRDWFDPIIGAESRIDLHPRWFLAFRGDFGGFGAGSDFTANGSATLGWRFGIFGRPAALRAGYRALFQDYDEDVDEERFEWDMTIHGPTLGLYTFWG
jgi:hypothetical protein